MVGNIIIQLNQRLDALLIGAFLGSHSVGLYSVGKRVIQMGDQTLSAAIGQVAVPSFAKIQDDDARIKIAYLNAVQSLATITFPMFALVALFAEEVTMIFLGLKWIEGAPVLAFLAIAATIGSLSRMDGAVLLAKGRAGLRLAIPASKAIGAIFAFLLGYTYGIVAVAAAMATMSVILGPLFVSLVKSVLPISHGEYYRCMLPMLVSTISACASAWGIDYLLNTRIPDWAMLAVAMPLALAVYWQVLMKTAPEVTKRLLGYARETLK
jgi:O-antigen/teichoic acid export membrane protein